LKSDQPSGGESHSESNASPAEIGVTRREILHGGPFELQWVSRTPAIQLSRTIPSAKNRLPQIHSLHMVSSLGN